MTIRAAISVQCLYFSPTGSTRRIVETIAEGANIPARASTSITKPRKRDLFSGQIDGDLLIIGVPIYTCRIPSLLHMLRGSFSSMMRVAREKSPCQLHTVFRRRLVL
jgi:hypothetical protein